MARSMMKIQMDHALSRLSEAVEDILGPRPDRKPIRKAQQRAALVRTGAVKITPALVKRAVTRQANSTSTHGQYCDSIEDCVRAELVLAIDKVYVAKPDLKLAKWEQRRVKLMVKFREAKDEIILGDVERALKLIAEFRKTKI